MGSRGSFLFSFRFPGRNLLGEGGVTTPCALHNPACSPYTGHMEAAGCGPEMEHNER